MNAPVSNAQSQDEAQIRHIMAERETAMRARDAGRLVASYAADVVDFNLAPPLQQVAGEVRDVNARRAWFAGFDGPIEFEIRDLNVTAGEDVAFCHSLNRLSTTPRGAQQSFNLWFRATVCFRKVDGTWRITHEHNSTPFYMAPPFGAAIDLQP